jgi:hypothetical protein
MAISHERGVARQQDNADTELLTHLLYITHLQTLTKTT